ncbi:MAG TPA: O-methyltransferase [Propionibacteriaceae bacterium]|nr:O-methyltransferase [Propionibacteriaceae bacterium]
MNASSTQSSPKTAPTAASWAYAEAFVDETEAGALARDNAAQLGLTALSRGTASALTLLAKVVQARAVVEIGTGSGASGLALFAGMQPDGVLTSVDIEPEHQQLARRSFLSIGIPTQRFRLIAGAALIVLPKLSDGAYDLVFVDADKLEYAEYVEQGVRLLRHGGVLVVNDALWHDQVADPGNHNDETDAIRDALGIVSENDDLVPALLPVGSGLLVAVKR